MKKEDIESYKDRYFKKYGNNGIVILYREDNKIVFSTKYGLCKTYSTDLLRRKKNYWITSAIDKTEYFINMLKEIYNDIYDYSFVKYINHETDVLLSCEKHGVFYKKPSELLHQKQGCHYCGREKQIASSKKTLEDFIKKANIIHNNKYDYSLTNYTKLSEKVLIICPEHGEFKQLANNHLQGNGCKICNNIKISKRNKENPLGWSLSSWEKKAKTSKHFEGFKLYIIKCWDEDEEFFKIGRTFNSLFNRFNFGKLPYNYEVIKIIKGESKEIYELELKLKKQNKKNKYFPKKEFRGKHECFVKLENFKIK